MSWNNLCSRRRTDVAIRNAERTSAPRFHEIHERVGGKRGELHIFRVRDIEYLVARGNARGIGGRARYDVDDHEARILARCKGINDTGNAGVKRAREEYPRDERIHRDARDENRSLHAHVGIDQAPPPVLPFSFITKKPDEAAEGYPIKRVFGSAPAPK